MIDLNKLETFVYIAELQSFTEAAKILHLSQPTLSHHIRMLEKDLGIDLFIRSASSGLSLSDAGRVLYPWARKLLRRSVELQDMMASFKNHIVGELRIACSTTAGKYILPQLAARFKQRFPGISVSILSCTSPLIIPNLLEGEANLGVISSEAIQPGMEIQEFFEDSIALIVHKSHPWVHYQSIQPSDLIDEPLIIREVTSGTRRVMLEQLAKNDIKLEDLNIFMEMGNAEAIVATVAKGYGAAFVSRLSTAHELLLGDVVEIPVEGMELRRTIYMVRKSIEAPNQHSQEVFWSFVHDESNQDLLQMAYSPNKKQPYHSKK
jgi:DNA-binding transcriptional LysR family regulator